MALQHYRYVPGKIVLIGKQPDGDSARFIPDNQDDLADIYRAHLLRPSKDGSHQLRLEGIDTPETHYAAQAQPRGDIARDYFLKDVLRFKSITWAKETVKSAKPETMEAGILTNSADVHGRPISYLTLAGNPFKKSVTGEITAKILDQTANYKLLEEGAAYPMLYSSAPPELRTVLTATAKHARSKKRGVWSVDQTERFAVAGLESIGWRTSSAPTAEEEAGTGIAQLIFPKLFRRACDFLKSGETDLVDWLKAKKSEDDHVIMAGGVEVPLSSLVRQENDRYRFDADVTEAVFVER